MNQESPSISSQIKQGLYSSVGCLAIIAITVFLLAVGFGGYGGKRVNPVVPSPPPPRVPANPYAYTISQKNDISVRGMPRLTAHILLECEGLPEKDRMVDTATMFWNSDRHWHELTVFMVGGPIRDFNKGGAYGIAEFTPNGLKSFQINDVPLRMLEVEKVLEREKTGEKLK